MAEEKSPLEGRKFDGGKPRYGLIPLNAEEEMVKVLTVGAKKYAPDNWMFVDNAQNRYYDAAMRHLTSWKRGQQTDPETGINHLAHVACCIFFMLERDLVSEQEWEEICERKKKTL